MSNRGRHKKSSQHLIVRILGKTIANRMMEYQKEQGNIPNLDVFLSIPTASRHEHGFTWNRTREGFAYWNVLLAGVLIDHHLYQKWKNDRR